MSNPLIKIAVSQADATLVQTCTLTAGMQNTPTVKFTFSEEWSGLGKTAVVRAGNVCLEVLVTNNQITVPVEALASAGVNLIIGVYGTNTAIAIPTVWCACGEILSGTIPNDASNVGTATQSLVDQMLAYAGEIEELAEEIGSYDITNVAVNDTNAGNYGVTDVTLTDSGAGDTRTITFKFDNLKGNGIYSISWSDSGTYKGRINIKTDYDHANNLDGTNFDALVDAIAYLDSVTSDAAESAAAAEAAEQAIEDLGVSATTLATGADATVTKTVDQTTGAVTLTFGLPRGEKGETGDTGATGYPTDEQVAEAVGDWLEDNVDPDTGYVIDNTLLIENAAADAKKTGEEINAVKSAVSDDYLAETPILEIYATSTSSQYYFDTSYLKYTSSSSGKYVSTRNLIPLDSGYSAVKSSDANLSVKVIYFDSTGTATTSGSTGYLSSTNFTTDKIYFNKTAKKFILSFRKVDETAFTTTELFNIQDNVVFYKMTDKTLTVEGKAADASITGRQVRYLADKVMSREVTSSNSDGLFSLTSSSGIYACDGTNTTSSRYCRSGFLTLGEGRYVTLGLADYEWCCWTFNGTTWGTRSRSQTNKEYIRGTDPIYVKKTANSSETNYLLSFRRADGAVLTTSTSDETSDFYKIRHALHIYRSDIEALDTAVDNNKTAIANIKNAFNYQLIHNSPAAVRHMMDAAETYLGRDDIWYNNANVAYSQRTNKCAHNQAEEDANGKYGLDCSSFAMLCLRGTPFSGSRYVTGNSGSNKVTGGYTFDEDTTYYTYRTYGGGGLLANQLARYAAEHGFLYKLQDGSWSTRGSTSGLPLCTDIRPGDLLFRSNAGSSNDYYDDIGHVMVVADVTDGYVFVYEAIDMNVGDFYYTPAFRKRSMTWLLGDGQVYVGARFPLAERGEAPLYCNIVHLDASTISVTSGTASEVSMSVSGENLSLSCATTSDMTIQIPFTAPGNAICSFGGLESNTSGITVSIYDVTNSALAKYPDQFATSGTADMYGNKCYLANNGSYAFQINIASGTTANITMKPFVIKGITLDKYRPYIAGKYELEENI